MFADPLAITYFDPDHSDNDEHREEYDATVLKGGVRGKYFKQYQSGANLALLAPEVRAAFPTDEAVNSALRSLMSGNSSR